MSGFKPQISGLVSDRSTTALLFVFTTFLVC